MKKKQKCEEKQIVWTFQSTKKLYVTREYLDMAKNGKPFWRETDYLLIAAQNNPIRTNYVKEKVDKTSKNNNCRLCENREETMNLIISECSKLTQKSIRLDTTGLRR